MLPELNADQWRDPWWRLSHLYWIVDETGTPVRFQPNPEQREFYDNLWTRNVILKARQLGFSTLLMLLALDQCMFVPNFNAAVIADSLENAGKLFRKITFAYNRLPKVIRDAYPLVRESGSEYVFANGSSVGVGTSARGGTLQFLHVSEFGKIARKYPDKAREIRTGAFEAVAAGNILTVESTAEGAAGDFYDLSMDALNLMREGKAETALDFRMHFFPWFKKDAYRLDPTGVVITDALAKYFRELEAKVGVKLDDAQRAWYAKKLETLKRDMKREYPSTPEEAFEQAIEGAVYGQEMAFVRERGRITDVPLDPSVPVNTFWDFGVNDASAIWLHQRIGLQNRFIRYFEDSGKGLSHYWHRVIEPWREENKAVWGKHYLPHDADHEILGEHVTTKRRILDGLGMRNIVVVPRIADLSTGIDITRTALERDCWFDRTACADGIKCLDSYQYEWNDRLGVWSAQPLHNWASHGSDAFRAFAQGYQAPIEQDIDERRRRRASERNWRIS